VRAEQGLNYLRTGRAYLEYPVFTWYGLIAYPQESGHRDINREAMLHRIYFPVGLKNNLSGSWHKQMMNSCRRTRTEDGADSSAKFGGGGQAYPRLTAIVE
jgi:hypothetical protein